MMASLLQNDSVYGRFPEKISAGKKELRVGADRITVFSERDPEKLPWAELNIDVVIESTGVFNSKEAASAHLRAGAKKVLISAPATCDATFVIGVNDDTYNPAKHHVISNASCTTNCFVPMVKVLDDAFGVVEGLMTTAHGYTGDQNIVDGPHSSDPRRARAAAVNIVPTSTGAARSAGLVLTKMVGKLDGMALRVPIPDGSITDFTAVLKKPATVEQINAAFKAAATKGPMRKVLDYTDEPLVSSDIVGRAASCTFDSGLTMSMGTLVKIAGWYDNEMGYSTRLVELTEIVAKKKAPAKKKPAAKKPAKKAAAKK
jgi:glyceraldehyde 3-phosphate dehydrogenase